MLHFTWFAPDDEEGLGYMGVGESKRDILTVSGLWSGGGWGVWGEVAAGPQFPETMNPIYSLKTVSIASAAHKAF